MDWRTVKKYIEAPAGAPPRASTRQGSQPGVVDPFVEVIDAMLRRNIKIKASVIHERLVAEYGFGHSYQRVKLYVAQARPRVARLYIDGDQDKQPVVAADHLTEHVEPLVHVARHHHTAATP